MLNGSLTMVEPHNALDLPQPIHLRNEDISLMDFTGKASSVPKKLPSMYNPTLIGSLTESGCSNSSISPRTYAIGLLADSCLKADLPSFVSSDSKQTVSTSVASIEFRESSQTAELVKVESMLNVDTICSGSIPVESVSPVQAARYNRPRAATISYSLFAPMEPEFVAAERSRMTDLSWLATAADDEVTAADLLSQLSSHRFSSLTMSPQAVLKSPRNFETCGKSLGKRQRDKHHHTEADSTREVSKAFVASCELNGGDNSDDNGKERGDAVGEMGSSEDSSAGGSARKGHRRGRSNSVPDIFFDTFGSASHLRQLSTSGDFVRNQRSPGPGYIGIYSPEERKRRIKRFLEKRSSRVWTKKVKYDVRKNFADSRIRVKGRFIRKQDEAVKKSAGGGSREAEGGSARSGDGDEEDEEDADDEGDDDKDASNCNDASPRFD